ncbi:cholecystokinin receptor type A [Drosophila busckii]|uniref:cholecystokinin receptor type A n=1 Tax=Drosophila busckii TaxID=30019 RepID=UPI00083ED408|nr:cholecystokinin receptor type A [Drosophila busckii]
MNDSDLYLYYNGNDAADVGTEKSLSYGPEATTAMTMLAGSTANRSVAAAAAGNASRIVADVPIWVVPCYSIILLFAVVGNLLVLLTLVQNRRMRTITNVFLLNLAISDTLLGVLCMPVTLVGTLLRHFIFGEFLCKLIQFAQASSVAVSSWTLVAISCERYYAICHPLRSRTWQTINHANKIIAFIWLGALACMTPIALFSQLMPTSRQGSRKCREQWPAGTLGYERAYNIFLDLVLLVLPLLALSFAYLCITRTLYVSMRNERDMNFGSSGPDPTIAIEDTNINGNGNGNGSDNAAGATSGASSYSSSNYVRRTYGQRMQMRSSQPHCPGCGAPTTNDTLAMESNAQLDLLLQQQQQQQPPQMGMQYYYADNYGSKRRLVGGSCDGRRQLYGMRSGSIKSGGRNQQQQQFNCSEGCYGRTRYLRHHGPIYVDGNERRKSLSTPSLRITEATLRRSNESKSLESKKRVVKMLFVLVLEFFICWTPLYVLNTMTMLAGPVVYEYIDYTTITLLQLLAYSSSCCNPITYCFMNASFRRAFVDTFKGMRLWNGGRLRFCRRRSSKTDTNLSVAGNSIALANSVMSSHTILESPRL